jgi:hypothetical protein
MNLVVYSAHYGTADPLNPEVFGGFDTARKVLFTDQPGISLPGVEIIVDPLVGLDPARASRRAKLMPHRYFPDMEHSLWLDNKSRLKRDPQEVLSVLRAQSDAAFLAFRHFRRDCVYQEGQAVWENGLDDYRLVKSRLDAYRAEGMPAHAGLIEGHFLFRRHNAPDLARFGERWFEHVLRYSRRDQVSFPYLVWKLGLRYEFITALDWRETVEFTVFDRKTRKTDFPRKHVVYQQLRGTWHKLRRRLR